MGVSGERSPEQNVTIKTLDESELGVSLSQGWGKHVCFEKEPKRKWISPTIMKTINLFSAYYPDVCQKAIT